MSEFSELCPLFATGVFKEVVFPYITMTDITTSGNALCGTTMASHEGCFTFGRTVIVTGAFVRRAAAVNKAQVTLHLNRHAGCQTAVATIFGTLVVTISAVGLEIYSWAPMNVTAKTFESSDVLGFACLVGTANSGGVYDLIVRYKDK